MKMFFLAAAITIVATHGAAGQTAEIIEPLKRELESIQALYANSDASLSAERDARCPGQRDASGCRLDYSAARTVATRVRGRISRALSYLNDGNLPASYMMFQGTEESAFELQVKLDALRVKYPAKP